MSYSSFNGGRSLYSSSSSHSHSSRDREDRHRSRHRSSDDDDDDDQDLEKELSKYIPDEEKDSQRGGREGKSSSWKWPEINMPKLSMPSVSYRTLVVVAITFTLALALAALGVGLAALLSQKSVNHKVGVIGESETAVLTTSDCDSFWLLQIQHNGTKVFLPSPSSVKGCTFGFAYSGYASTVTEPEVLFVAEGAEFIGTSWDANFTANRFIQHKTLSMDSAENISQFSIISDGTHYRLQGPGVGVSGVN